jgi:tripartite-type tricarboxylate transporter receptor subunit TctC
MSTTSRCLFLSLALIVAGAAAPQSYPNKSVRMIVPSPPGGAMDLLSRIVGQKLHEFWGQAVVIDNRGGAKGNIGAEMLARSNPDGYTLGIAGTPHAINMSLSLDLRYSLAKDLAPIGAVAAFPSLIAVHPSLPVKSIKELIAVAKAHPGALNFGSAGTGSPNHLAIEILKNMARINMVHVPYKGSGPLVIDLIAGHVQLASMGLPPSLQHVRSGRLRAIAVTSRTRSPLLPDLMTVSESGLAGFDVTSWYGIFSPAGIPAGVVARVNADIIRLLADADVKERLLTLGAEALPMSPDEFRRHVNAEIAKWARAVADSGVKAGS